MRSTPIVIALQALTLLAAGYAAFVTAGLNGEAEEAAARAAAHQTRAGELEAQGRYAAAATAWRRVAQVARHPGTVDGALSRADRAAALTVVSGGGLPADSARPALVDLSERLAGGEGDDRVAAVGLDAVLRRLEGNLVAAAKVIVDAEAEGVASPWFDWQMGIIRLREGRTEDARGRLEALVKARPEFAAGLHRLGLVYMAGDQREAAIGALQKAIAAGGPPEVSLDLARLHLGQKMWAEAIPHLERVLRGQGGNVDALRLLAAAHYRLGRHAVAARTYRQAYEMDGDPRTLLSAAIALQAGGKQGEALAVLDTLMPRVEQLPEVAWQRGKILLDLGRVGEGRVTLERYLTAAAGKPEEAERMAEVRALLGQGRAQRPAPAPSPQMPAPQMPAPQMPPPQAPVPQPVPQVPAPQAPVPQAPAPFVPADP